MSDRMRDDSLREKARSSSAVSKWKKLQESSATSRGSLRWEDCGAEDLKATVAAVTEDGAALLLAKTSDGGALVIRVIQDRDSVPFYAADMAALNHNLEAIQDSAK